jgi:hypothetical protein
MFIPTQTIPDCNVIEFVQVDEVESIGTIRETKETKVGSGTGKRDACTDPSWDCTAGK